MTTHRLWNGSWKFRLIFFKKLLSNKEAIYREAMSMLSDVAEVKAPERNDKEKFERNMTQRIDVLKVFLNSLK